MDKSDLQEVKERKIKELVLEIEAKIRYAINYGIEIGRELERIENERNEDE